MKDITWLKAQTVKSLSKFSRREILTYVCELFTNRGEILALTFCFCIRLMDQQSLYIDSVTTLEIKACIISATTASHLCFLSTFVKEQCLAWREILT